MKRYNREIESLDELTVAEITELQTASPFLTVQRGWDKIYLYRGYKDYIADYTLPYAALKQCTLTFPRANFLGYGQCG